MSLSHGAVSAIFNEQSPSDPTLQVVDLKKMQNGKVRTVLSDGSHFIVGMFATQLTQLIDDDDLRVHSILSLSNYSLNKMGGKKVVIVLKVAVVQRDAAAMGIPVDVATGAAPGGGAAAPPPPQQQQQPAYGAPPPQPVQSSSSSMPPAAPSPYGGAAAASGAVVRADANAAYQPIDSLNPYMNRWTIKARVTNKGDMKSWNNARGSGTLFKVELLDDKGGEIAACFFKEAAEKFYPLLETNAVYTWSNGRLKVANKQYSSCNSDYEISFGADADIRLCDDDSAIQALNFNFRRFDGLEHCEPNSTVDVIGLVKRAGDLAELVSKKTGGALFKRDLTLLDDTGTEVTMTIWGDKAKEDGAQWENAPVLAVKKCKVSDYNGVSLSSLGSSQLVLAPDVPETQVLQTWWQSTGQTMASPKSLSKGGGGGGMRDTSLKSRKTVSCIVNEGLGLSEKGDFITVKGIVDYILPKKDGQDGPWYVSDPETKYKCLEQSDGSWLCERLGKTIQDPKRRFILTVSVKDETGSHLVSLFDDQAVQLLGVTADEVHGLLLNGEEAKAEGIYKKALFNECVMSLRVKQESYNDEMRVKVVCNGIQAIDFADESRQLLEAINAF